MHMQADTIKHSNTIKYFDFAGNGKAGVLPMAICAVALPGSNAVEKGRSDFGRLREARAPRISVGRCREVRRPFVVGSMSLPAPSSMSTNAWTPSSDRIGRRGPLQRARSKASKQRARAK